jgi:predicted branched-subunit amino acid permease
VREGKAVETGERVTFTLAGALAGARKCIPVAISGCVVGLVFGTLAGQAGLSAGEAALMSVLVFSGAAQFVVLGLWASPLPLATIALTTLVVGLRHVLMGAALAPVFSELPRVKAYASVFFMADENWALTMGEFAWGGATLVGGAFGGAVEDPARWGLDFAFTAVFLVLISGMWKGRSNLLPWTVAAAVAVAAHQWLPGQWYILLGGLSGSLAGVVRRGQ